MQQWGEGTGQVPCPPALLVPLHSQVPPPAQAEGGGRRGGTQASLSPLGHQVRAGSLRQPRGFQGTCHIRAARGRAGLSVPGFEEPWALQTHQHTDQFMLRGGRLRVSPPDQAMLNSGVVTLSIWSLSRTHGCHSCPEQWAWLHHRQEVPAEQGTHCQRGSSWGLHHQDTPPPSSHLAFTSPGLKT